MQYASTLHPRCEDKSPQAPLKAVPYRLPCCGILNGTKSQKRERKDKTAATEKAFLRTGRSKTDMPNLTRHKAITLRMTLEEFDFFQNQMRTAKQKTQTDFFLAVLRKKPIIVVEDLRPVLQELKRQGNNLNQVARQLNESSQFGEGATKVMNECWKAYRAVSKIEGVVLDAIVQGNGGKS